MHDTSMRSPRRFWHWGAATALAIALAIPATAASAAAPPDYLTDPAAAPGDYTEVNLAADRTAENFFYRIPALAHLGDGVVLSAWDARPGSAADAPNPNSIIQRRSTDNGKTWSDLQIIAAGAPGAEKYGYSDPSYVVDHEKGRVFAFFVYSKDQGFHGSAWGNDDENRQVISAAVIQSDDQGLTWSEPRLITDVAKQANGSTSGGAYTPVAGDVKGMFATSGEGIQLRFGEYAGRLIQQYAGTVLQPDGSTAIQSYSVYSDDNGATWHRGAYVGTGMDENKVVELSDGRVMLNSRDSSNGRLRKVAISTDGGETYGPVTADAELPDPTNNASITRLHPDAAAGTADARKLIFTNANNGANGDRKNGSVRLSCDDGETWPGLRTLETGVFGYSTATALDDGRVGVLWEGGYTDNIRFSSFDEPWLNAVCAPLSAPATSLEPSVEKTVPVTITNQEAEALTGSVSLFTPSGWSAADAQVSGLAPGASTTVQVNVTAPAAAGGTKRLQAAFTAEDGRVSQTTAVFELPQAPTVIDATITGARTDTDRDLADQPYTAGEQVPYTFRVDNASTMTVTVVPTEGHFAPFLPPGAGNCRFKALAVDAGYGCATPKHVVTADDIARGYFVADTTWTVSASGETTKTIEVDGGEVDVIARDPRLTVEVSGVWNDADGNGVATVGETVTWNRTVRNNGNVDLTGVSVDGADVGTLAAGASADLEPETSTLTAADITAGTVNAASVEASASNGERAADVSVEAGTVELKTAAAWDTAAVYAEGDDVSYDGRLWEASWWTKAQKPGDPNGPWQEIAVDAEGRTVWTPTRIFNEGDEVVYDGNVHVAKWWTRNQEPGLANGPWK